MCVCKQLISWYRHGWIARLRHIAIICAGCSQVGTVHNHLLIVWITFYLTGVTTAKVRIQWQIQALFWEVNKVLTIVNKWRKLTNGGNCINTPILDELCPPVITTTHIQWSPIYVLIARLMGPTWGPSGADRTQVGPMLAPWTLLSGWWQRLTAYDGLRKKHIFKVLTSNDTYHELLPYFQPASVYCKA